MNNKQINQSWKNLLIPFIIGLIVFIVSLLFHRFGSKRSTPQTISLFGCVFGLVFIIIPLIRMIKFKKYLNNRNQT